MLIIFTDILMLDGSPISFRRGYPPIAALSNLGMAAAECRGLPRNSQCGEVRKNDFSTHGNFREIATSYDRGAEHVLADLWSHRIVCSL